MTAAGSGLPLDAAPWTTGDPVATRPTPHLHVSGNAREAMEFSGSVLGGQVDVPFEEQVYGDTFGQVTDRSGSRWLVDVGATPSRAAPSGRRPRAATGRSGQLPPGTV